MKWKNGAAVLVLVALVGGCGKKPADDQPTAGGTSTTTTRAASGPGTVDDHGQQVRVTDVAKWRDLTKQIDELERKLAKAPPPPGPNDPGANDAIERHNRDVDRLNELTEQRNALVVDPAP